MRTERLTLEAIEHAHAPLLFEGLRDEALYQFIDDRPPASVETLQARYERWARRLSPDGQEIWMNWAVKLSDTNTYVGLAQATVHRDHSATIAYILFLVAWGQGYAREAVTEMLNHLEQQYAVRMCHATVDPRNERSIRLLQALAFERIEIHSNSSTTHGVPADEVHYSRLLRRELLSD